MVSAGMPELPSEAAVSYLQEKLCLDMSDKAAEKHFKAEIARSLVNTCCLACACGMIETLEI